MCKNHSLYIKYCRNNCLIIQRNFGNILYNYVQKYDILKMETLRKYEKLKIKIKVPCQTFNIYPKFLTFNLPNVTSHNGRFIRKCLLHSEIEKEKRVTIT